MEIQVFFKWLTLLSLILVFLIVALSFVPGFENILAISLVSLVFFILLNIAIYFIGMRAAHSTDKNNLTRLIMVLVFIKMISCLMIIVIYDQGWKPSSNHYILPFIIIYITYTVFEVAMLTKISKIKT